MIDPTNTTSKKLAEMNIVLDAFDEHGKRKTLTALFEDLEKAMAGLSVEKADKVFETIFKMRSGEGAAGMLKTLNADFKTLTTAIVQAGAEARFVDTIFADLSTTTKVQMDMLINLVQGSLIKAFDSAPVKDLIAKVTTFATDGSFDRLLATLVGLSESLMTMVGWAIKFSNVTTTLIGMWIGNQIGVALVSIGGAFINVIKLITAAEAATVAWNATTLANPLVLMATLIAGVTVAVYNYKGGIEEAKKETDNLHKSITDMADAGATFDMITSKIKEVQAASIESRKYNFLQQMFNASPQELDGYFKTIDSNIAEARNKLKTTSGSSKEYDVLQKEIADAEANKVSLTKSLNYGNTEQFRNTEAQKALEAADANKILNKEKADQISLEKANAAAIANVATARAALARADSDIAGMNTRAGQTERQKVEADLSKIIEDRMKNFAAANLPTVKPEDLKTNEVYNKSLKETTDIVLNGKRAKDLLAEADNRDLANKRKLTKVQDDATRAANSASKVTWKAELEAAEYTYKKEMALLQVKHKYKLLSEEEYYDKANILESTFTDAKIRSAEMEKAEKLSMLGLQGAEKAGIDSAVEALDKKIQSLKDGKEVMEQTRDVEKEMLKLESARQLIASQAALNITKLKMSGGTPLQITQATGDADVAAKKELLGSAESSYKKDPTEGTLKLKIDAENNYQNAIWTLKQNKASDEMQLMDDSVERFKLTEDQKLQYLADAKEAGLILEHEYNVQKAAIEDDMWESMHLKSVELSASMMSSAEIVAEAWGSVPELLSGGMLNAINDAINGTQTLGNAFRIMAADVLKQLANMIMKQLLFNAITKVMGAAFGLGGLVGGSSSASALPSYTIPSTTDFSGVTLQTLADGGRVQGFSPSPKADNIQAWLTAGEFVQPVASTQYYGVDFMEAVRNMTYRPKGNHFAEGGSVGGAAAPVNNITTKAGDTKLQVVNVLDKGLVQDFMGTRDFDAVLINKIRYNSSAIRTILGG